jgi:hypothetical protein
LTYWFGLYNTYLGIIIVVLIIALTFKNNPPKPYSFISLPLQSNLTADLNDILSNIGYILPQISGFIDHFNNVVVQNNINVITDSVGNMSIDVPSNMSDSQADKISTRLSIIDKLINSQGQSLNDLFQKGLKIEEQLKTNDPNYSSQLTDKISAFKALNASYKH